MSRAVDVLQIAAIIAAVMVTLIWLVTRDAFVSAFDWSLDHPVVCIATLSILGAAVIVFAK